MAPAKLVMRKGMFLIQGKVRACCSVQAVGLRRNLDRVELGNVDPVDQFFDHQVLEFEG